MKNFIDNINARFNALPIGARRMLAAAAGFCFAAACLGVIIKSIFL